MLKTIGRYRLQRSVGSDALTQSYEATAVKGLDARVIVRVGKVPVRLEPHQKARFDADARAAIVLPEAVVAPVVDHGVVHGLPYVVHPWMEGRSLAPRLDQRKEPIASEAVIAIAIDVATALVAALGLDPPLAHRAMTPDALWIDDEARVRIAGYALGPVCAQAAAAHPQLLPLVERFTRSEPHAADMAALGAVLERAGGAALAPPELRKLVSRMLDRDPDAVPTAEEALSTLRTIAPKDPRGAIRLAFGIAPMTGAIAAPAEPSGTPARGAALSSVNETAPKIEAPRLTYEDETAIGGPVIPEEDTDEAALPEQAGGFYFDGPTYVDRSAVPITELLELDDEAPPEPPAERTMRLVMPEHREEEIALAPRRSEPVIEAPAVRAPELVRVKDWFESPAQPIVAGWPLRVLIGFGAGAVALVVLAAVITIWLAT